MITRIVITGAPASGKTEALRRLKLDPRLEGYTFFEELARQILLENPSIRHNKSEFHKQIYLRQVAREDALGDQPFITDRGTVDAFAFHPESLIEVGTTLEKEYSRYTAVIHLQSTANLGEAYYRTDDVRDESIPEALAIERAIAGAWQDHPGYHIIPAYKELEQKYKEFEATVFDLMRIS